MAVYITSDHHFQHDNILKFGRGHGMFNSINHHDQYLKDRWTDVVTDDDIVYVLGDIALGYDLEASLQNFAYLPGQKFLVPGNHDRIFSGTNSRNRIETWTPIYESVGFTILPENHSLTFTTDAGETEVLISHFPYGQTVHEGPKDKFAKNRPANTGLPLIHGHTHSEQRFNSQNALEFHVGVDANNFTPVHEDEIIAWLNSLPAQKKPRRR